MGRRWRNELFALALNAAQTAEMDNFTLAMTVLITGLVVVFAILLLLTFYHQGIQHHRAFRAGKVKGEEGRSQGKDVKGPEPPAAKRMETPAPRLAVAQPAVDEGIPGEVIAAIAAAVAVMNDQGKTNYSVQKRQAFGGIPSGVVRLV